MWKDNVGGIHSQLFVETSSRGLDPVHCNALLCVLFLGVSSILWSTAVMNCSEGLCFSC